MFFSKTTPSISISQDKLDLSSHPASPTDSLMSTTPSLAPLQASRRGFFNSFQRPALSSSSVTSVATTSKSTEAAQSAKIAALQQEIEQLKEMADINQLTMRDVADDLQKKDMECADLRCTVSMLDAGLKQAVQPIIAASAAPSQLELKTMQENLEFANDCRQTLKRSVRAKEEEMVKLADKIEELAQELKGADKSTAAASSNLLRSLNNANDQLADLQRTITDKDERLATVSSELFTAKLFHDKLLQEHGEYSHNACKRRTTS
jgi:chromosome segregation ATPase